MRAATLEQQDAVTIARRQVQVMQDHQYRRTTVSKGSDRLQRGVLMQGVEHGRRLVEQQRAAVAPWPELRQHPRQVHSLTLAPRQRQVAAPHQVPGIRRLQCLDHDCLVAHLTMTMPIGSSAGASASRAIRSANSSSDAPASSDAGSNTRWSGPDNSRTMCGTTSPTKPINPAAATAAPTPSAVQNTKRQRTQRGVIGKISEQPHHRGGQGGQGDARQQHGGNTGLTVTPAQPVDQRGHAQPAEKGEDRQ
uniref:Transposase n=1 Tax=Steinernema glaseri TaxID=37863 RepID=A0A1I7YQH4_9BILA